MRDSFGAATLALAVLLAGAAGATDDAAWKPGRYHDLFTAAEREQPYVQGRSMDLYDWPFLDGQWEGILCADDGNVYFGVSSHSGIHHAQLFRYSIRRDHIEHVADMGQACGEMCAGTAPQGKIHSQMWEDGDAIYCGTAAAHSTLEVPYKGGHWIKIDKRTGAVTDMGKTSSEDCLIVMAYDPAAKLLYAHTNVKGMLMRFNPATREEKFLGIPEKDSPAKLKRGIALMIDPEGNVYGCRPPACTFWQYNPRTGAITNLAVNVPPPTDVAAGDTNAIARYNTDSGRIHMALWDKDEQCFYAIRSHDEMLLRFFPPAAGRPARAEALQLMGLTGHRFGSRYASCTLVRHGRTIYYTPYTGWGGVTHVVSYDMDRKQVTDHGPLVVEGDRRVNEVHSLAAGPDGKLYMVAFVFSIEGKDPVRPYAMRDVYPFHPRFVIVDPAKDFRSKEGGA